SLRHQPYARGLRLGQDVPDPLLLPPRNQRAEIEVALGRSGPQPGEGRGELFEELAMDGPVDDHAATGGAGLARVLDDRADQGRQGRVEVGVGEYQLRRLAAQLEGDGAMVGRGDLGDPGPGDG